MTSLERVKRWKANYPEENRLRNKKQGKRYYKKHRKEIIQRTSRCNRKRRTGVSHEDFERMLIQQEGKCAICLKPFSRSPHADHDHKTGKPRQLLCHNCNLALGLVKEDILILKGMIDYINRHSK